MACRETAWRDIVNGALAAFLAPPCAACGAVLHAPLDGPVCAHCWQAIVALVPPLCARCGDVLPVWRPAPRESRLCARCRRRQPVLASVRAVGAYDGALGAIIHAFKYGGRRSLAPSLGALMRTAGADVLDGADFVVPVPLHPRRRRARGFNQAALLAATLGVPAASILHRVTSTPPQADLPAAQRHGNVRGAFALAARRPPFLHLPRRRGDAVAAGCVLVLVDDVMTTGATLEACARVLRAAGAREVRALTAARAVSRQGR